MGQKGFALLKPSSPAGEPSIWAYAKFAGLAAAGAVLGFLTGTGLWGEITDNPGLFVLQSLVAGLGAFVLFDPGMELMQEKLGIIEVRKERNVFALTVIAAVTLLMSVLHHSLASSLVSGLKSLSEKLQAEKLQLVKPPLDDKVVTALGELASRLSNLGTWTTLEFALLSTLIVVVCVGMAAFTVTLFWAKGAAKQPPKAATSGAVISFMSAVLAVACGAGAAYLALFKPHLYWQIRCEEVGRAETG